jgi:hypothetical protein
VPLRRPIAKEAIIDESQLDWVSFEMYDGEQQVFCRISTHALKTRAQRDSKRNETPRETFCRCREQIEQIASDNYDEGERPPSVKDHQLN